MTSMWVSLYLGFLLAIPIMLWQAWAFFIPAFETAHERMLKAFVFLATAPDDRRRPVRLLRRAAGGGASSSRTTTRRCTTSRSRRSRLHHVRDEGAGRDGDRVRAAAVRDRADPPRASSARAKLRRNRRIGYFIVACIGVALPGVDPVTTIFETIPLIVLYELSIWLSVLLDRRAERAATAARRGHVTEPSRPTGCCPSTGRRSRAGACASRTGGSSRSGRAAPTRHFERRRDRARLRERALAPRVRRLRGLRRRPAVRAVARDARRAQAPARCRRTCSRSPACGVADSLAHRGHDHGRLQLLGRRATAAAELGLRAIVYLEVFADDPEDARAAVRGEARARRGDAARRGSASRRTRRTPARSRPTGGACRSASRSARTSPRARARTSGSSTGPGRSPAIARSSSRRPGGAPSPRWSRCSGPSCSARTASRSRRTRSRCSPSGGVPVAHCPRSNALLGCGIAPLTALRAAGVVVGLGTDSPASTPSFDVFEEMRAAIYAARARERRAEALLRRGRTAAGDRSMRPALCESTTRWVP